MEGPHDEGSEDEFSLAQENNCDNTSRIDRDGNGKFVPSSVCRSPSKVYSLGADLKNLQEFTFACEQDATSRVGFERPPVDKQTNPIVAGPDYKSAPRSSNTGDFPRENQIADIRVPSGTKRREYHSVEGSEDEAVGDDGVFSEQNSDDDYIPGFKSTTNFGRKETKNGPGDNAPVRRIDSALQMNPSPAYNRQNDRPTKKRKLVEESADEAAHGRFGKYPASNGFRSGWKGSGNSDRRPSYELGRKLQHGTTTKGPTGNKVDATNESSSIVTADDAASMSSKLLDDSDEEYIPGPPRNRSLRRTKTGMKRAEDREGISSATSAIHASTNKRRKDDIEESWLGGADSSTRLVSSEKNTRSAQETDEGRDLEDRAVRESDGKYRCLACGKRTNTIGDMGRHLQTLKHQVKSHVCPECGRAFTRKDSLKRHITKRNGRKCLNR